jgi:hypothetical protein
VIIEEGSIAEEVDYIDPVTRKIIPKLLMGEVGSKVEVLEVEDEACREVNTLMARQKLKR